MQLITNYSSNNYDERKGGGAVRYVILHYTDTVSVAESLHLLTDDASKVSSHYFIDEQGQIYYLVDERHRAWHAGESHWQGCVDINSHSIGIELQNPGHSNHYKKFSAPQIDALLDLLKNIRDRHKILPSNYLGHSDVAPARKKDPGELFPWGKLASQGFGIWPYLDENDEKISPHEMYEYLMVTGYDPYATQKQVIQAFQRHYCPDNTSGNPDIIGAMRAKKLFELTNLLTDTII